MKNRKMKKTLKWLIFIAYIAALVYFMFFAEILGKSEETEKYSTLAEQTRNVINEKFYNRKQACYCDDSLV